MTLSLDNLNQQVKESSKQVGQTYELPNQNAVFVGHPVKPYKKNKKDADGKTIKDDKGNPIKEDKSSGYQYTFVQVGSFLPIRVVLPEQVAIKIGMVFAISGKGYAFTNNETNKVESYFFSEDVRLQQYK